MLEQMTTWEAFRRTLTRFDRAKINPRIAIRNTVAVVLPLALGGALGQVSLGLVGCLGALNVAYSDGDDPAGLRVRRMLLSTLVGSVALAIGGLSGRQSVIAVLVAGAWAFAAGMLVALGTAAADIGTISLVTLIVFASRAMTPQQALLSGLVALGGGLLQTALSLLFGPGRRHWHERQLLGNLYSDLASIATFAAPAGTAPPATAAFTQAREMIAGDLVGRAGDHSPVRERFSSLLNQAERIRLRLLTLGRLRRRLQRDELGPEAVTIVDLFLDAASQVLAGIAKQLKTGDAFADAETFVAAADRAVDELRARAWPQGSLSFAALVRDATQQMDHVMGQLRATTQLAASEGLTPPALRTRGERTDKAVVDTSTAWSGWWHLVRHHHAVLVANLTLNSVACRHAVRIAVCVAIGDALGRSFDWQRTYWIPMTIAIVLKPDFMSTFSRGALRLTGTFFGLILATAIYRVLPASNATDVILVGMFTLLLRWVGPANYGIFTVAVSALVVALIAGTGIAPNQVIALRGLNTAIGGTLALLAYGLWPTWERTQTGEMMARLLDAYRAYVRAVEDCFLHPEESDPEEVTRTRQAARVARSNVEASADRLSSEPGVSVKLVQTATAMLASSHNFVYAAMTLEGAAEEMRPTARENLRKFFHQVELTLYYLASALRGSSLDLQQTPDLRDQYRLLLESGSTGLEKHSLVLVETDRMTNALNTLKEQVGRLANVTRGSRK